MASNPWSRRIAFGVAALFSVLVITILMLLGKRVITYQLALLMFVALIGLYVGFGVLIAVYRFVSRLD